MSDLYKDSECHFISLSCSLLHRGAEFVCLTRVYLAIGFIDLRIQLCRKLFDLTLNFAMIAFSEGLKFACVVLVESIFPVATCL